MTLATLHGQVVHCLRISQANAGRLAQTADASDRVVFQKRRAKKGVGSLFKPRLAIPKRGRRQGQCQRKRLPPLFFSQKEHGSDLFVSSPATSLGGPTARLLAQTANPENTP